MYLFDIKQLYLINKKLVVYITYKGEIGTHTKFCSENTREKDHFLDLIVDQRMIFNGS
jgi:hypothetical protein